MQIISSGLDSGFCQIVGPFDFRTVLKLQLDPRGRRFPPFLRVSMNPTRKSREFGFDFCMELHFPLAFRSIWLLHFILQKAFGRGLFLGSPGLLGLRDAPRSLGRPRKRPSFRRKRLDLPSYTFPGCECQFHISFHINFCDAPSVTSEKRRLCQSRKKLSPTRRRRRQMMFARSFEHHVFAVSSSLELSSPLLVRSCNSSVRWWFLLDGSSGRQQDQEMEFFPYALHRVPRKIPSPHVRIKQIANLLDNIETHEPL